MSVVRSDYVETLEYLKRSVQRMRGTAWTLPDNSRVEMLRLAGQIAADTAKLESELIAAGYLPMASNVA